MPGWSRFSVTSIGPLFVHDFLSLSCSDPPSQLQPQFHPGAGFVRCGVRLVGEGGHRDRASFTGILPSPLCHSQSHWGLATGHRSLTPQRLGGALQFSHGDCSVRSPISPSGDWMVSLNLEDAYLQVPFHPASRRYLRFCVGDAVYQFRALCFGPSGVHPRHGSCFLNYASPRISSSPLPRRLASPGLYLPGTSASERLPPLAVTSPRRHSQSFEELFGPDSDSGLSWDDARDFSFEGFPDPQTGSEVLSPSAGLLIRPPPSCVGLEEASRDDVIHVSHCSRFSSPHEVSPASPQCSRSSPARRGSRFLGRWLPQGSSVVVRRLPSSRRSSSGPGPPRSLSLLRRFRLGLGCSSRRPPSLRLVVSPLLAFPSTSMSCWPSSMRFRGFCLASRVGRWPCILTILRPWLTSGSRGTLARLPECGGSGTSSHLRVSVCSTDSTVHSWSSKCSGRFPQPPLSGPRLRMDFVSSGCLGAPALVASHHRPLRNVAEPSPASVFLADVRPAVCRHRCNVAVLGRSASLCLPSLQPPSSGVGEGSGFQGPGADVGGSLLASAPLVPGPSGAASGDPPLPAMKEGSSQITPLSSLPPEPVRASADCLSYLRRSARQAGFSDAVAGQLTHCRRRSTHVNYQAKWVVYCSWCHRHGHSVSRPTVAKVADFLLYLRRFLSLSFSSIASYHSMLSGVFHFIVPELSSHFVLHDLLRSFHLERPLSSSRVPPWDLLVVLQFLRGPPFEPLDSASLRSLTQKVLFLVSLATARRVGELQAVSR